MRKSRVIVISFLFLSLAVVLLFGGCSEQAGNGMKVVSSTSLIAQIVERIGGDKVDVTNIIPPAQCPGHFDCTPGDIQKLVDADLFLLHGWQGEVFSDDLIASANNEKLAVVKLNVKVGENMNWMAPPVQIAAVDQVTETLVKIDEANAVEYQEAADTYKKSIVAKEAEVREKLASIKPDTVKVLCGEQQTGFVRWAGFDIAGTYGEPDKLTPQVVKDLVDLGKTNGVTLIIDNMQSGMDAGAGIAEELGCNRVILSNFPGGYQNTDTWEKTIDYNVELLVETLSK